MNDNFFLDTNILIYLFDDSSPEKKATAEKLIETGLRNRNAVISYQVVQEFINVSTKKFKTQLPFEDSRFFLDSVLNHFWKVFSSRELFHSAMDISERWQYSFYDSLIIAAALESSCNILYTEDLQNHQKIYYLEIINPFE